MYDLQSLTEREKEALRLLVAGHDTKSVARLLELSIHTVNERLRDARRKLGVSSSREAARLLAEAENGNSRAIAGEYLNPNFLVPQQNRHPKNSAYKKTGVVLAAIFKQPLHLEGQQAADRPIAWLAGGMLIMSLIIAAFVISFAAGSSGQISEPTLPPPSATPAAMDLMPIADKDHDGKVSEAEYRDFSEQGWNFAAPGKDSVKLSDLDQIGQMAFLGLSPDADGFITREMYVEAIPVRFKLFDQNKDGFLSSDELNGRAFQS